MKNKIASIARLLIYSFFIISTFVLGILFETNRMYEVDQYTAETNRQFYSMNSYIKKHFNENGVAPKKLPDMPWYLGAKIDYVAVLDDNRNGYILSVAFPDSTVFSRYLGLEDAYTQRLESPLAISQWRSK